MTGKHMRADVGGTAGTATEPAIFTRGLTKRYGKARGIEGIDLTVERGEIFGFIGPNGAGKSTTIRTLLGLIKKTSGEARVLGFDIERDHVELLRHVGYLPSEVFYYDGMRARDLFKYAASFYADARACMARAEELAARLDLDLARKIDDMSLGNKKKVGIVQGLMHTPELIILDEPTSGLDPLMQKTFFELIREENERGATVLFSSHILSEVQRTCDRVAIIKEGRIVETRSIAQMRAGAVKRVTLELAPGADAGVAVADMGLAGIRSLEAGDAQASFLFEGELSELLGGLAALRPVNVELGEPELEEVFMHYYADEPIVASMGADVRAARPADGAADEHEGAR